MKNIIITLILISIFLFKNVKCQTIEPSNFYELLKTFKSDSLSDEEEDGSILIQREAYFWGSRLYPHGDCRIAANAITNYANNYNSLKTLCTPNSTANWESLGQIGRPVDHGSGYTEGSGRMQNVVFDPKYNTVVNGIVDKTVYSIAAGGGLWKSSNGGTSWSNANTDLLPQCFVSDLAIDNSNSDYLYISTGGQDEEITLGAQSNMSRLNPIFTIGIYRSTNFGQTWTPINNGFLSLFGGGGTTRKIVINPANSNQLFVSSTLGLFTTSNALANSPQWSLLGTVNGLPAVDPEWRGIEFKPGNSNVIYASGKGIFIAHSIPAIRLIEYLTTAIEMYGKPKAIRSDNGPEFISKEFQIWMNDNAIHWSKIPKASPQENAFVERFNRTAREDLFDPNMFFSVNHAIELASKFKEDYNYKRPHESLNMLTPIEYAA